MNLMHTLISRLTPYWPWVAGLLLVPIAAVVGRRMLRRWANPMANWLPNLRTFSQNLEKCSDPRRVAEGAVHGSLKTLGSTHGFILLEANSGAGFSHVGGRGLSKQAVAALSEDGMRNFSPPPPTNGEDCSRFSIWNRRTRRFTLMDRSFASSWPSCGQKA